MFEAIDLEIQRLPKSSAQRLTWRRGIRLLLVALMVFVLLSYAGLPLYMAVYWTHIPRCLNYYLQKFLQQLTLFLR